MSVAGKSTNYRPDIDGLRAVAILGVVVFHGWPSLLTGGFVGVDVFFVISGFLITSIIVRGLTEGRFSFATFYANRVKRIFPALVLVLFACLAFGWRALMPGEYAQLGRHVVASSVYVQNIMLWTEAGYFDAASMSKPLMHLWSLAIEEQFYLLYPLACVGLWRFGRRSAAVALGLVAVLSFAANGGSVIAHPVAAFFLPHTRVWELLAGGLLAFYQEETAPLLRPWLRSTSSSVGLGLIAVAMVAFDQGTPFPGWAAVLPVGGAVLVLLAGPEAYLNRVLLANRVMVGVGLISYPLYLWHWPLLSFQQRAGEASASARLAAVVASFVLAWLTWRFVERPLRFGGWTTRQVVRGLAGAAVVAAVLGGLVDHEHGVETRFPEAIRGVATWEYDFKTDARVPACWLTEDQTFEDFGAACWGGLKGEHGADTLVLWGDSHAARLYPGLLRVQGASTDIAQLTRNSCPPAPSAHALPGCQKYIPKVLEAIAQHPPKRIVLFGAWHQLSTSWARDADPGVGLLSVCDRLREAGVEEIVLLGPAPEWNDVLPKLVVRAWERDYPLHRVPRRLSTELTVPVVREVDDQLRQLVAGRPGLRYISALDLLCNGEGCLTFASDSPTGFMSWDRGHLTTDGATLVARQLGL